MRLSLRGLGCLHFVPLYGPAQSFLKIDLGPVPEMLFGSRQIRQRMLHIAGADLGVFDALRRTRQLFQHLKCFIQVDASAAGNVEDFSRSLRGGGFTGEKIGLYGVIDVGEVAALAAVSENRRRFPVAASA